ncbi:hypothetical protein HDE_01539 [Halotydeus destructor]|nr:hypothetical protein HDE_01539 [Halotydeus destructor]
METQSSSVWYEPTDLSIAHKVLDIPEQYRKPLKFASPNFAELITMAKFVSYRDADKIADVEHFEDVQQVLEHCDSLGRKVLEHCFETLLITVGKHGVVRMSKTESGQVDLEHFEATVQAEVVSVSGAGDCFTAATVSGLLRGLELSAAIRLGLRAAAMSLPVPHTVPDSLRQLSIDAL